MHICYMVWMSHSSLFFGGIFFLLVITVTAANCSKKNNVVIDAQDKYEAALEFAHNRLGPSSKVVPNEDRTLFLCTLKTKLRTQFLVSTIEQRTILAKRSVNGSVKWHSNSSISVQDLPNVLEDKSSKPSDFISIIELNQPL